jgi:hypothetical protein
MSDLGHSLRFDLLSITSDMPSTSDVSGLGQHLAKGPEDVGTLLALCEQEQVLKG